jgi:metallo-beta-lactamase class B
VGNAQQKPFQLFGNAYYVVLHGLGSILITSDQGDILINGALPESAPEITVCIKRLGFKPQDVQVILNTNADFDHTGGIAALQKITAAAVYKSPASKAVLKSSAERSRTIRNTPHWPHLH